MRLLTIGVAAAMVVAALIACGTSDGGSGGGEGGASEAGSGGTGGESDAQADDADSADDADAAGEEGAAGSGPTPGAIIFLHHNTGGVIWSAGVLAWVDSYNAAHSTNYDIIEQEFPKSDPYGWNNYPYDYWNIWVYHAGEQPFFQEPTLEILAKTYGVIVFKHGFLVSGVDADSGNPDITSGVKTVENYKLQYSALKDKLHTFATTKFIVWTGAALTQSATSADQATRAKGFFEWVTSTWDEKGDNIFVWDFRKLETQGGLYMLDSNAANPPDSNPSDTFALQVAPLFSKRIVDVIEGRGDSGSLTGQ